MDVIILILAIAVILLIVKHILFSAVDKGTDAIHNRIVREQEKKTPPKAERLADQYKNPDGK